ncbi:MAG: hypothetical protein WD069_07105 [Planctomycetales bacterium]
MDALNRDYLKLLSRFHFVVAGISAVVTALPAVHLLLGVAILTGRLNGNDGLLVSVLGWVLVAVSSLFLLCGWTLAVLMCLVGRRLAQRRSYMFCLLVAAVECVFVPFGTVLGVFTAIVLTRPGVRTLFGLKENQPSPLDWLAGSQPGESAAPPHGPASASSTESPDDALPGTIPED